MLLYRPEEPDSMVQIDKGKLPLESWQKMSITLWIVLDAFFRPNRILINLCRPLCNAYVVLSLYQSSILICQYPRINVQRREYGLFAWKIPKRIHSKDLVEVLVCHRVQYYVPWYRTVENRLVFGQIRSVMPILTVQAQTFPCVALCRFPPSPICAVPDQCGTVRSWWCVRPSWSSLCGFCPCQCALEFRLVPHFLKFCKRVQFYLAIFDLISTNSDITSPVCI